MEETLQAMWEQGQTWFQGQGLALWLGAMALLAGEMVWLLWLWGRVRRAERHYRILVGKGETDVMTALERYVARVEGVQEGLRNLQERLEALQVKESHSLQSVGVVRYDAFPEVSGSLSFAVAFLDDYDNGLVLNGILGRDTTRLYVKPLQGGRSPLPLTEEEQQAIAEARRRRWKEGAHG